MRINRFLILGFCSFLAIAVFGQTTVSFSAAKDNTIFQESGDESSGQGWGLFAGRTASVVQRDVETVVVNTSPNNSRRALVQFDISSIPSNAVVSNVEIGLFIDREPDNTSQTMSFHRLLADWGEAASAVDNSLGAGLQAQDNDATWTHRFYNSQDTWTNQGGDFESLASASESVEENPFVAGQPLQREVWSAQGLIDDVQGWIDGDFVNYGWILIGDESKNKTAKRFISKDNPNFFAPKPQLTITYTIPGQEPASSALINETNVYHNWVEIYNPTDDVIDLSIHSLCTGATCNTIGSASAVILNGNTMLAAGEYTVVNWDMLDDTAGEVILQSSTGALDTSNMVDFIQYGAANQSNADEALAKGVWDDVNNAISISADTTMSLSLTFSADYKSGEDTGSTEWSSTGETPTLKNGIQTDAVTLSDNLVGGSYTVLNTLTLDGKVQSNTKVVLKSTTEVILDNEAQVDSSGVLEAQIIPNN